MSYLNGTSLRLIITIGVLTITQFTGLSLLGIAALPFILDTLDCTIFKFYKLLYSGVNNVNCSDQNIKYQINDKIIDLVTYFAIVLLFHKQLNKYNVLLWILLIWRTIGVVLFTKTQNKKYLKLFFDGLNAILIVIYLASVFPYVNNNLKLFVGLGLLTKFIFETIHHRNNFKKK
jgi:hypothetical protein